MFASHSMKNTWQDLQGTVRYLGVWTGSLARETILAFLWIVDEPVKMKLASMTQLAQYMQGSKFFSQHHTEEQIGEITQM